MEFTLLTILILIGVAATCEFIDSSMGMMYGTILTPVLVISGFEPLIVVPSVLLSQAVGGLMASVLHHRLKNADLKLKIQQPKTIINNIKRVGYIEALRSILGKDARASFCIAILGVIATVLAVLLAVNIPKVALKTYIGALVLMMGVLLFSQFKFKYTWKKILWVGILSAFNKGLSGGGFGPVTTSGQMIAGKDGKSSIGATTLAEVPICLTGFVVYLFTRGLANWFLLSCLVAGATIGALIGPHFTARFKDDKKLRKILAIIVIVLGVWTLTKTWLI